MKIVGKIIKGKYFDSVSLMRVSQKINQEKGIVDSSIVMGTAENLAILRSAGLLIAEFENCSDNDLLVAIKGEDSSAEEVLSEVDKFLVELKKASSVGGDTQRNPKDIESAKKILPDANLVMISIAGKYAAVQADKALDEGLHVMLFSDNISVEDEVALKTKAAAKNLLVMGPDCGTAIIQGIPLAFANVVKRGNIGIVAASGTGLQEVSTLISNGGGGISQAIGTGGRDIKKEVGGLMFLHSISLLGQDDQTEKLVLIAKPPHVSVTQKIKAEVKKTGKPAIALFLGFAPSKEERADFLNCGITLVDDLAEAAKLALGKDDSLLEKFDVSLVKRCKSRFKASQKYVRALFSGGTFASETQIIWSKSPLMKDSIYSNVPALENNKKMKDCHKSLQHTVVDLGDDEFTVGRPHPMIDFSTRVRRIEQDAKDPETAVILLDIVLGYGSHLDPLGEVESVLKRVNSDVVLVASVTGTEEDPQVRSKVVKGLEECGVLVFASNAAASKFCMALVAETKSEGK